MAIRLVKRISLTCLVLVGIFLVNISPVLASAQSDIENGLICPACFDDGMTVAACADSTAQQIKEEVRQKLASGQTKDQIMNTYVAQYGEKILTSPPKKGFNLLAWVIPFSGIVLGGALIYLALSKWVKGPGLRKGQAKTKPGVLDDYYDARVEEEYKKYL